MTDKNVLVKGQLPVFVLLSILIAWIFWAPLLAPAAWMPSIDREITGPVGFVLYIIAMTSMWIVAAVLIVRQSGIEGIKARFVSLLGWRKNVLWYLVAILIPMAVEVLAPAVFAIANGSTPAIPPWTYVLFMLILGVHIAIVLMLGGIGYALPLFGRGRSRPAASLLAGVYTLVWMAPMCLSVILRNPGYRPMFYALGFVPMAIMILWLYYLPKRN